MEVDDQVVVELVLLPEGDVVVGGDPSLVELVAAREDGVDGDDLIVIELYPALIGSELVGEFRCQNLNHGTERTSTCMQLSSFHDYEQYTI